MINLGSISSQKQESIPPESTITVNIQFSGTPTLIRFSNLKYGKEGVMSLDWDDGAFSSIAASELMEDAVYTDGAGKSLFWRGGLSVIGRSPFNNTELGDSSSGAVQYSQMLDLIAKGWDIQNHGMYSTDSGNFTSPTALDDIVDLDTLILDRIGYPIATTVVPAALPGYVQGALTA